MSHPTAAKFAEAKSLERAGEWAAAAAAYRQLTRTPRTEHAARRRLTECLMRLQRWEDAHAEIARTFASGIEICNADIKRFCACAGHAGDADAAQRMIEHHARTLRDSGRLPNGEYILYTAAAPKTGSTSLSVALAAAANYEKTNSLHFPTPPMAGGRLSMTALEILRGKGIVNHCHLSPARDQMDQLRTLPWVKVVVHFRNPVETVLSTIDLIVRNASPLMLSVAPDLDHRDTGAVTEFVLDSYLPELLDWMQGWLRHVDAGHPSVGGTSTLEEVRRSGQDAVAARILDGLGIPRRKDVSSAPQRTGIRLTGERAARYGPGQRERVESAVPTEMRQRFGW